MLNPSTSPRLCEFPDCGRPHRARGLCVGHVWQRNHGGALRPIRVAGPPRDESGNDLPPLTDEQRATVEANLGLVYRYLKDANTPAFVRDDRFQDGVLGLMRAVQKFDATLGFKFSTYAMEWIRAGCVRGRMNEEGLNFRQALTSGETYAAPCSIDAMLADFDEFDGRQSDLDFIAVDDDLDAVDAQVDAARLVGELALTDDEVALLTWPCKDTARWLGVTHQAVSDRRRTLRLRLVARLEALAA